MIASKTLAAIDAAMRADGGARFRELQRLTMPQCYDAYRGAESPYRAHLGASLMGQQCSRRLWYTFHWASAESREPHMLRLWNRGHLEEGRMIALLLMIGVQVWQTEGEGKQFRISDHWGHYGGSLDGVLLGVPDAPGQYLLGEFKTHNDKSFDSLVSNGLHESKFEHYIQMQQYMRKRGLEWGLYLATNKNDDRLHGELIELNAPLADRYIARAGEIIAAKEPPPKISNVSSWWQCKFCPFKQVCHFGAAPVHNCRTCAALRIVENAGWHCDRHGVALTREQQEQGCAAHTRAF